jgi:hypothetical protein
MRRTCATVLIALGHRDPSDTGGFGGRKCGAGELERFSCWRLGVLRVYSRSAASRNQTSLALSALGTFLPRQSAKSSTATFSM